MSTPADLSSLRIDRSTPAARGRSPLPIVFVLLAVAAVVAGFLWFRKSTAAVSVTVAGVTATGGGSATSEGISANGYVLARRKASVSSKILGRLASVAVSEGSNVKNGEIIARLEDADYLAAAAAARARVVEAEANLAQTKRALARAQTLRKGDLVSDRELEDAQTAVETVGAQLASARAQSELAAANLENTRVRAPFSGTVLRKDAEVGEIVAPSSAGGGLTRTAIVTIADLSTLEVEVDVNEAYIAQVRNGQPARITLDAYTDTSFAGRVRQVVPTADRQKATVLVKVSILDRDPRILSEMGAKVLFLASGANASAAPRRVFAPKAAIVQGEGGSKVWVVENGLVREQAVDVGSEKDGQVDVRQGLSGGESLVVNPPPGLKAGLKVKVTGK